MAQARNFGAFEFLNVLMADGDAIAAEIEVVHSAAIWFFARLSETLGTETGSVNE